MVADCSTPGVRPPTAFALPRKLCPKCGAASDAERPFCSCGHSFAADSHPIWEQDAAQPAWQHDALHNQFRPATTGCAPLMLAGLGMAIVGGSIGAVIGDALEGDPIMMRGLLAQMFGLAGAVLGLIVGLTLVAVRRNSARR